MTKKNSFMKYIVGLIFILLFGAVGFVMVSPQFEQTEPNIVIEDEIYWNLKSKLEIQLSDASGIKYYKIVYNDGQKSIDLNNEVLTGKETDITLEIEPPKFDMFYKGNDVSLDIEVVDNSKWNYLNGNMATKKVRINLDIKKPTAQIIENSRYIRRGGSGIVIVKVEDENLQDAYISFNDKTKFDLVPFYKDSYFVSLIAWDVNIDKFKRINLIAIDKAGNKTITKIPFYIQALKVKKDIIKINSNFIESVSTTVLEQSGELIPIELPKRFIEQNKILREKNVNTLRTLAVKHMDRSKIDNFDIKRFKRLRGSKTAAGFAERRSYFYEGEKIDEAWHLGMDWASVRSAPIKLSNDGKVIFNEYLGIYGNTIVIDHQMGLFSLYAHTSSSHVEMGQMVKSKQKIANTGSTGAVMGDHLHFGILVQGIEVNPLEWMDKNWIKNNITKTITNAKKAIDSK
ncbi:MAG: M23 family metallopeptidase [Arcobacteraceae bacterium]|nr:M23 family metallopeptidase [Arcobacteraceae bacterium]